MEKFLRWNMIKILKRVHLVSIWKVKPPRFWWQESGSSYIKHLDELSILVAFESWTDNVLYTTFYRPSLLGFWIAPAPNVHCLVSEFEWNIQCPVILMAEGMSQEGTWCTHGTAQHSEKSEIAKLARFLLQRIWKNRGLLYRRYEK